MLLSVSYPSSRKSRTSSVRVFVIRYQASLMGVRMHVSLPAMTVLVLMLNVLMLMQNVRVRMRYIPVTVLVSVLRGHPRSILDRSIRQVAQPYSNRLGLVNRYYTPRTDC